MLTGCGFAGTCSAAPLLSSLSRHSRREISSTSTSIRSRSLSAFLSKPHTASLRRRWGLSAPLAASSDSSSAKVTGMGLEAPAPEKGTPLSAVAEAFEALARSIEGGGGDLQLGIFMEACSLVSVLFGCLGFGFKFAEMEYTYKVNDLLEAAKTYDTLPAILDLDVKNNTVRKQGSHSRNLRKVRLGLDFVRALFEQLLSSNECSLKDVASTAYTQIFAPYHTWTVRKAVSAGMYALPTREDLFLRLNENDHSVQKEMQRYVVSCGPVIQYIDNLYLSRKIVLDW